MSVEPEESATPEMPSFWVFGRWLAFLALAAAVALAVFLAASDKGGPAARVAFTPDGVVLEGRIAPATLARFAAVLAAAVLLDTDGRTVVDLDSEGGNLDAALLMRRLVRLAGRVASIETRVGQGRSCQSACVVLFAAAPERVAAGSALFMFHAPAFAGEGTDPGRAGSIARRAEGSYLAALAAVDPPLVQALEAGGVFDSTAPRFATGEALVAGGWRLVTRREGG
jgi:hypothetical protein